MQHILALNVVHKSVLYPFYAGSLGAVVFLVLRSSLIPRRVLAALPWSSRIAPERVSARAWAVIAGAAVLLGALVGVITIFICEFVVDAFGQRLDTDTRAWAVAAFAATALAVVNLWRASWLRRTAAVLAASLFLTTAALGINAGYGLNTTLGELLDVSTYRHLTLPKLTPARLRRANEALWKTWRAPAGMAREGEDGLVTIPAPVSGFKARDAFLYLPPAALVADPPALPVLIMMMGQPGGPQQAKLAVPQLNTFAKAHHGLAPIVLTVDQLGNPYKNPLCVDSGRGHVYTYVITDVVNFVRRQLNVASDRRLWAVGGYSNGGECALAFAAKRPNLFGSVLDISGEIEPRDGSVANTLRAGFGGSQHRFDAEKPANILRRHHYRDELAVFTSGSLDKYYTKDTKNAAADARAAGMTVHRLTGPGVDHRSSAIVFGAQVGLPLLGERFGLTPWRSMPRTEPRRSPRHASAGMKFRPVQVHRKAAGEPQPARAGVAYS